MLLDDGSSLNDASISDLDSIYGAQEETSSSIVIKGNISCAKISWPEAVPNLGTTHANKVPNSPSYGSFANTNIQAIIKENNYNDNLEKNIEIIEDNDSGMSSEENDDSVKVNLSPNNKQHVSISSNLDKDEVITKCLIIESQYSEQRNEIPSCSYVNHVSIVVDHDKYRSHINTDDIIEENSNFVVIDLTCDNLDSNNQLKGVGTNDCNVDCDSSIPSLNEDRSLVPVCNEIAISESQKLLSLSLSILLAALLQAMQCFAQFLEDIVVPQRQ